VKKLLFIVAMIPVSFLVKAQHVQFGLKGGLNVASVHVENNSPSIDPRVSAHVGGLAHIHLSKEFALQPELVFSGQGFIVDANGNADQHYKLNYINLPVLVQFMTQSGFRIETGPQLGVLASAKLKAGSVEIDVKDSYKTVDFAWALGVGYVTKSGFGVDARYNLGISKINDSNGPNVTNRVFQLGVFYQFKNAK
jgi:hypothetical protein